MRLARTAVLFLLSAVFCQSAVAAGLNSLRQNGFSLIPAPQKVELLPGVAVLDCSWGLETSVSRGDIAVRSLVSGAQEMHGLTFAERGESRIVLALSGGAVTGAPDAECAAQAYRIRVTPTQVEITGNAPAGLFYGVQSFLQLLRRDGAGRLVLPLGEITDWPDLRLRVMHWDTKHHQNRMETMKRYIDQSAFFKANAISFEMEDKYEYPRHPVIGAPGAYTKAEMVELTRYALERHVQIIPDVQAPAHMNYVLKHPEFAHLRADSSNYQICMCDEEAMRLIFDMYQDMIDATPGVEYFHVSTDEVYYAGISEKCKKLRPYNEINRSRLWVEYVQRVNAWMAERGRKVLLWVEYPLLTKDVSSLPAGLIDAITGPQREPSWLEAENKAGIEQMAYTSMQGAEWLFPNYFTLQGYGQAVQGRMQEAVETPELTRRAGARNLMGTFCAAWDDAGLNDETFWLGWAVVTAYGWNMQGPGPAQATADFFDAFYGPDVAVDMRQVYSQLELQARYYENLWDLVWSNERGYAYGYSGGKRPIRLQDETLSLPALPAGDSLAVKPTFHEKYAAKIAAASELLPANERLQYDLARALGEVSRNRYNIEVLGSIAALEGYAVRTMLDLDKAEAFLVRAGEASAKGEHALAVNLMVEAGNVTAANLAVRDKMWRELTAVWEKGRFPKNEDVAGRKFLHVMDDVKDHFADRRRGLDYMIAPFERMDLPGWHKALGERIKAYAAAHKVPVSGLAEVRLED
ncbi:beta-N-acetylhexosaminidase [bacterium]|nr:beta-N-acetylhexosaminidase [bacterium]